VIRSGIGGFGVLTALAAALVFASQATAAPNFVVIIADDMAWNDAGAYGHPHIRTPNIDRLAAEGMRFDRAFLSTSSCSPSRASIMTGRYPHSTDAGELHQPLPASQATLGKALGEAGYYTASAGKWHLGNEVKGQFDHVVGGGPSGCEEWVPTLRDRPRDRPFFLWLAAVDPHRPYQDNTIPNPHTAADAIVPPFLPDVPETRRDIAAYYDEIARMDGYIGQILDELDRQEITDETMVIFMSDNGRPFPRCKTTLYDSGIKTPFVVRYPGTVEAGSACGALVSAVDIAPTLLDLAEIEAMDAHQGRSFAELLTNPSGTIRDYISAEHNWHDYQARERAVRTTEYLYIRDDYPDRPLTPPADAVRSATYQAMIEMHEADELNEDQQQTFVAPRPKEELYDVNADPYSLNNLANDPDHADTLAKLRAILDDWQQRTNDTPPETPRPDEFDRVTGERLEGPR